MKKVLLSAFACLALTATTYATNGEKEIKNNLPAEKESFDAVDKEDSAYPCVFTITTKDPKGGIISQKKITASTNDSEGCCQYADCLVELKKKDMTLGQTISHDLN